jgi:hypothetical protein
VRNFRLNCHSRTDAIGLALQLCACCAPAALRFSRAVPFGPSLIWKTLCLPIILASSGFRRRHVFIPRATEAAWRPGKKHDDRSQKQRQRGRRTNSVKVIVHTIRGFRCRDRAIRGQRERPSPGDGVDGRIGHDTCLPASPGNGKGPPIAGAGGASERGRLWSMSDEGCPFVGHRDEARSVDRKSRTSQLLTPLALAMV